MLKGNQSKYSLVRCGEVLDGDVLASGDNHLDGNNPHLILVDEQVRVAVLDVHPELIKPSSPGTKLNNRSIDMPAKTKIKKLQNNITFST